MKLRLPQQFGPYTLNELIARGGMAEIYRATMPGVGGFEKTVAIKKILPHLAENEEFITMLIDEARIIVSINHANIAQVYDLGKIEDDYYIAMEYIHGIDLSTIAKDLNERGETVPVEHAAFIGSCICAGLHVAHNKNDQTGRPLNIVHRDVSPHNILISFAGDVKIIDFGVAKARGKDANTQMGVIKGKLLYMAPEQAMAKPIDGRADLFAAGLILYRMLTNRLPFEGDNEFQIYNNILSKEIVPPKAINPAIPEEMNQIVMMLLQRDPSKRYQDGYGAKVDLDRTLHSLSPGYSVSRLSRWVEDNFTHLAQKQEKKRRTGVDSGANDLARPTPARPSPNTGERAAPAFGFDEDEQDTINVSMDSPEVQALIAGANAPGGGPGRVPSYTDASGNRPVVERPGHWGAQPATPSADQSGRNGFGVPPQDVAAQRASVSRDQTGNFPAVNAAPPVSGGAKVPIAPLIGILLLLLFIAGMLGWQVMSREVEEPVPVPPVGAEPVEVPAVVPEVAVPVEPEPAEALAEEAPAAEPVTLNVSSTPKGARVLLEDNELGITPFEGTLPRGEEAVTLRIEKEGFETAEVRVTPLVDLKKSVTLKQVEVEAPEVEKQEEAEKVEPEPPAPKKKKRTQNRKRQKAKSQEKKSNPAVPLLGLDEPAPAGKKKKSSEDDVLNPFDL